MDTSAFLDMDEEGPIWKPPPWPKDLPPPGFYSDVDFDEYAEWPAISQSNLKLLKNTSLRHLRAALDGELKSEPSDAMRFGSALHCFILEPHCWEEDWCVADGCQAKLKSGPRKGEACGLEAKYRIDDEWRCGKHGSGDPVQNYVTLSEAERLHTIEESLKSHPIVKLLRQRNGREVSFLCDLDGLPFKGRLDWYAPAEGEFIHTIVDLKTIQQNQGSSQQLQRQIIRYGYDVQAYAYSRGVHELTGDWPAYIWLFLENAGIYDIACYQAPVAMLAVGRNKFDAAWSWYLKACRENKWPGYTEELNPMLITPDDPYYHECFRHGVEPNE